MKILVTGSSGHLGEALVRTLSDLEHEVVGLDVLDSPFTTHVGSIADRNFVRWCMKGIEVVLHAATLHKPHVATHGRQDFIDTNITGTLNLLEEAVVAGVSSFVYTSTTSVFGDALVPPPGAPAAWVTEEVVPIPKNIYGVSPRSRRRTCASCSTAISACLASSCGPPASFRNRTTTAACARSMRTTTPRRTSISIGVSTSKTW
jgi:nucleoside-diphosphate-sugar epimerase